MSHSFRSRPLRSGALGGPGSGREGLEATPPLELDRTYLTRLRRLGLAEGFSTLVLFGVAMPLKYLAGLPVAVSIVGPIHGLLFMALAWMFYAGIERVPLSRWLAAAGILGAVVPFGPFVIDRWLAEL